MFGESDTSAILAIPTSPLGNPDVLRWHHSKDGEYTVRSGYWIAMSTVAVASPSDPSSAAAWWKSLWKLALPPKIKLFVWRVCK